MEVLFKSYDGDKVDTMGRAWLENGVARWEPKALGLERVRIHVGTRTVRPEDGMDFLEGLVDTYRGSPYWFAEFADGEGSGYDAAQAG